MRSVLHWARFVGLIAVTATAALGQSAAPSEGAIFGWVLLALLIILAVILAVVIGTGHLTAEDARLIPKEEPAPEPGPPEIREEPRQPPEPAKATPAAAAPLRLFISYRRRDTADVTGRISDRLVQHFGSETVFKDVDSIPLGLDFRKHIHQAVAHCDMVIVVIGKAWANATTESGQRRLDDRRDHLRIEIEAALEREIPVIPVLVQGATMPSEEELPDSIRALAYRNAIAVRPDPDFHRDIDRLIRGIEALHKTAAHRSGTKSPG